jgi:hypothetical protein
MAGNNFVREDKNREYRHAHLPTAADARKMSRARSASPQRWPPLAGSVLGVSQPYNSLAVIYLTAARQYFGHLENRLRRLELLPLPVPLHRRSR